MAQILILNFDGTDGATTSTEEMQGLSPSVNTRSEIDTSWQKFGTGSLQQTSPDAVSDAELRYAYTAQSSAAATLHAWIRIGALPGADGGLAIGVTGATSAAIVGIAQGGVSVLGVLDKSGTPAMAPLSTVFAADTNYHLAIVINGHDLIVFVDGVVDYTYDLAVDDALGNLTGLGVTASDGTWRVDAMELTAEAKWTSGFTTPSSAPEPEGAVVFPVSDCAEMQILGYGPAHNVANIPCGEIVLEAAIPYRHADIPCAEIVIFGAAPDWGPGPMLIPVGEIPLPGYAPSPVWVIPAVMQSAAKVIYTMTLTGAADGVDDADVPISSFQARMRDGDPSYLACVVPDSLTWEPTVSARTGGQIVVKKGVEFSGGTRQMEEIARADFEHLYFDRGARSNSMTVVGYRTASNTSPKDWAVTGVSFLALQADGKRRIRAAMDLFLRVGDTCIYGDGETDSLVVGTIQYTVQAAPAMATMEVTEA